MREITTLVIKFILLLVHVKNSNWSTSIRDWSKTKV